MTLFPSKWFRRKSIDSLVWEMNEGNRLDRRLGPFELTSLGVGATIGTGIYVLTGVAAHDFAGPSLVLSFLLAGFGCAFAAMSYSELAAMVPVAGSVYTYAYATLGELVAWIIGWDLILEYSIGACVVASGWSNYLQSFMVNVFGVRLDPRFLSAPVDYNINTGTLVLKRVALENGQLSLAWFNLPAVVVTAIITVVLVIGIKESVGFNLVIVLLNLAVILTIVGIGASYVDPRNWRPFLHEEKGWAGVSMAAARVFFAYIGFDSISTHSEEARCPQRDLSIGIIGSLTICTILYVAVAAVLTGLVPYGQIDDSAPLAAALNSKGLTIASGLVTLGILAGMTSSLLVGILSQPRILLAMARDGMLPLSFFGAVHPRFKTPWKSTILCGFIVALGAALAPLGFLAELVSIGTLFAFVIVSAAVWILRVTDPKVHRPFRTPLVPLVSIMGVLLNGGLMCSLSYENWIRLMTWLVIGLFIYFGYGRNHSVLSRRAALGAEETGPGLAVAVPVWPD